MRRSRIEELAQRASVDGNCVTAAGADEGIRARSGVGGDDRGRHDDVAASTAEVDTRARHLPGPLRHLGTGGVVGVDSARRRANERRPTVGQSFTPGQLERRETADRAVHVDIHDLQP